jgi:hypothetical protein
LKKDAWTRGQPGEPATAKPRAIPTTAVEAAAMTTDRTVWRRR